MMKIEFRNEWGNFGIEVLFRIYVGVWYGWVIDFEWLCFGIGIYF